MVTINQKVGQKANSNGDKFIKLFKTGEIIVRTKIDLIVLSSTGGDRRLLEYFGKHYKRIKKYALKKGNYCKRRVYQCDSGELVIVYRPRLFFPNTPQFKLQLHQPRTKMLETVQSIFERLSIYPIITKIELPWDFYLNDGLDHDEFKDFIERHLFLKYQRGGANTYERYGTFYTNNIRRSVKGIRLYVKRFEGEKFVRLELELHKKKIEDLGISWPLTSDNLCFDVSKLFEFRRFNYTKLTINVAKRHRTEIARFNKKIPRFNGLYERHLTNWGEYYFMDGSQENPLMTTIQNLRDAKHFVPRKRFPERTFKNISYHMTPMDDWNELIQKFADEQRFGLK